MSIDNILTLIGGLALFLLGMNSMGDGLEKACGNKMKKFLEKLTSNRFLGVIVGMLITMVIQSSSATTVMVVGFVNAGMMSLTQAVWVIMGANIGTTITGQLVALDIGFIAPVFAIVGVVMMVFIKKPTINEIGKILCGFGVLFIGMDMMSSSMMPLRESEAFVSLMTKFSNPFLGILVGMVFTAVIQSSSASIGILQALAISGVIKLDSAVYVLFGQNIGTCITALLASMGTNRCAKRTTLIHLLFNLIGTSIFTILCVTLPITDLVAKITPNSPAQQIANMHTIFNITTTLLLLPFGTLLVRFAEKILPDIDKKESVFAYLGNSMELNVGGSAIHLENVNLEVRRMYQLAFDNINLAFDSLINQDVANKRIILENEDLVDKLNEGITKEITHCLANNGNSSVSLAYASYMNITNNVERLSDHSMNLFEYLESFVNNNIEINEEVIKEIKCMKSICDEMLANIFDSSFEYISNLEDKIDNITIEFKNNMMERLKKSICTAEGCLIYSSILIDFERIGDHLLNISEDLKSISNK